MKILKSNWFKLSMLAMTLFLLTGCMSESTRNSPINLDSGNIWERYIVGTLARGMNLLMDDLGMSFGVAIIVFTIIVRLIFTPVYMKGNSSSEKMQKIQPLMREINQKYEGKKDQESMRKKQTEMANLYREHKVNPCGACFWPLLQMPIFLAMYNVMVRFPKTYPYVADKSKFLWINLAEPDKMPYVLVILVAATMFGTQWISQKAMNKNKKPGESKPEPGSTEAMTQQMMKTMMYVMPIMMAAFAYTQNASLALYWVVGNLFLMLQTIIIRKPFKKESK